MSYNPYEPNDANKPPQYPTYPQQLPPQSNEDKGTVKAAWITGSLALVGAILVAIITGGFGLIHGPNPSPGATSVPSAALVQLQSSYNAGMWTESNGQVTFTMSGIIESTDGKFTAAGGTLGLCAIKISNGIVRPNQSVSFSVEQNADINSGCPSVTADSTGTVAPDGLSMSGTWSGQFQGQPFSGQWSLS